MNKQHSQGSTRELDTGEWILMIAEALCFIAQVAVCTLAYNTLGATWLIALGWVSFVAALLLGWRARLAFETHGGAPETESWLRTRNVVTADVYGLIRHPMYLSFALISVTLVLFSQHWLNVALGAVFVGLVVNDMRREEQGNLDKFGDAYRDYMQRVPRMNILAGVIRAMRARKPAGPPL